MEEEKQVIAPVQGPPVDPYVYFGVLGKSPCGFCRMWRDRFIVAGAFLTVAILVFEAGRIYLESRD
jgi:hypothetical protein